jgi:Holliday junction DNA helicase RuvA
LVILSVLSTDALVTAIISGDENALIAVPGVGKKSAARIILELKDKAKLESVPASGNQDVIAALVGLGWPEKLSREVVADISDPNLDTATLLRNALARLAKK